MQCYARILETGTSPVAYLPTDSRIAPWKWRIVLRTEKKQLRLINSIDQSPSREANNRSVSQQILLYYELRSSLLCSQEQGTDPYPVLHEFSRHSIIF
jgi:hypothetical protein